MAIFKILVVGPQGSGKTLFVDKILRPALSAYAENFAINDGGDRIAFIRNEKAEMVEVVLSHDKALEDCVDAALEPYVNPNTIDRVIARRQKALAGGEG